MGRPLRHRDFRLLWIGQTAGKLGSSVTGLALPLAAIALDASTLQVTLLSAAPWLPWLLIGLPAGAWVDRLPRRPVMLACDLTSLLLLASVPAAAWLHHLTFPHLLAVALGSGCAGVVFQTAYQVYLPSLLAPGDLAAGNARIQAGEAAAQVGGPGVAGLVARVAGAVDALVVDAASFLISAVCVLAIRTREPPVDRRRRGGTLRREIGDGLRFVARDPYLRVLTLFSAASNIALFGYQSILVPFLVREVGASPGTVGLLVSATSLGGLLGAASATAPARRFGSARTLLAAEIGAAPFGLLIPLTTTGPGLALAVAGGFAVGAGAAVGNVLKGTFRQAYTPRALLGRVTVTMQLVSYGTIPLGALLGGALATAVGVRPAMWITTGALAASGLVLLPGPLTRHRDLPSGAVHHREAAPAESPAGAYG
jgi:MFS family permease